MELKDITDVFAGAIEEKLSETVKSELMVYIKNILNNEVQTVVDSFVKTTKEQAANETGWCAFRDKYFLPGVVQFGLYAFTKVAEKIVESAPANTVIEETVKKVAEEAVASVVNAETTTETAAQ